MRPIYREMGILPKLEEAMVEEKAGS